MEEREEKPKDPKFEYITLPPPKGFGCDFSIC
jgi:hypothetical protein